MIKHPLKQELNAYRINKSHKRIKTDNCSKCISELDIDYDKDNKAIKVTCPKCGVIYGGKK